MAVTITDVKGAGADGNTPDNVPFGCALKCEGDPLLVVEAAGTELPETVTVAAVTVAVGGTAKIEPTVTPTDASGFCLFAVAESGRKVCRVDAEGNVHGLTARRDGGRGEVLRQAHRERRREGDRHGVVGDTRRNMSREAGEEAQPPRPFLLLRERNRRRPMEISIKSLYEPAGHRHRHRARDRPHRRRG